MISGHEVLQIQVEDKGRGSNLVQIIHDQVRRYCKQHPNPADLGIVEINLDEGYPPIFVAVTPDTIRAVLRNEKNDPNSPLDKVFAVESLSDFWSGRTDSGKDRTTVPSHDHQRFQESQKILQEKAFLQEFTQKAAERFLAQLLVVIPSSAEHAVTITTADMLIPILIDVIELLTPGFFPEDPNEAISLAKKMLLKMKGPKGSTGLSEWLVQRILDSVDDVRESMKSKEVQQLQGGYDSFTEDLLLFQKTYGSKHRGLLQHMISRNKTQDVPFTEGELKATIMGITIGAVEPIATVITECLLQLSQPGVWDKYSAMLEELSSKEDQLELAKKMWVEAARTAPPAILSARTVHTDISVGETLVSAGSILITLYGVPSALDSNYQEDQPAAAYIPGRADEQNTTGLLWGYGTRRCPGMMYAWELGGRILLELFKTFKSIDDAQILTTKQGIFQVKYGRFSITMKQPKTKVSASENVR